MPATPNLGRSKHATPRHASKGTLSSTVSTTTRNMGDTWQGTANAPWLSWGSVANVLGYGVRLTGILGVLTVNKCHYIRADWCLHQIKFYWKCFTQVLSFSLQLLRHLQLDNSSSCGGRTYIVVLSSGGSSNSWVLVDVEYGHWREVDDDRIYRLNGFMMWICRFYGCKTVRNNGSVQEDEVLAASV